MKVLHIGPIKPARVTADGVNHSIRGMIVAQAKIGLEVGCLSSLLLPSGEKVEPEPEVTFIDGPRKKHYNPWLISMDWIARIQAEFGEPDIVHFHSIYSPFQSALARRCRQAGWPYIVTPHGEATYLAQSIKRAKKHVCNFLVFRAYVRHASAMHALTCGEAVEMQALFEAKKIITVPNGVDERLLAASEELSPVDLSNFGRNSDLILGFVGRIDVYIKGIDLLLQALAELKLQPDAPECRLLMIGPFHRDRVQDRDYVLSAIRSLGLEDNVKVLGPKYNKEKLRYLLACDVYVQTSRSEGMPMSVLEAMALKLPCLVTPETRVGDIVRQGGGWECELHPQSIAETIKRICKERDSLKARGQRSRKLVQTRFTWRKVAQQMSEEYAQICKTGA